MAHIAEEHGIESDTYVAAVAARWVVEAEDLTEPLP